MFLASVGAKDDPACGGRQMPSHWGSKKLHIFTGSSPTGTRVLHAVGAAEAELVFHAHSGSGGAGLQFSQRRGCLRLPGGRRDQRRRVLGGAELRLPAASFPLLFVVEDNGYAISVPVEVQTAGGNISGLLRASQPADAGVDGTDFAGTYQRATEGCRVRPRRQGPGPDPRARHPALFAFALRRRAPVQDRGRARQPEAKRDPVMRFATVSDRTRACSTGDALEAHRRRDRRGVQRGHRPGPGEPSRPRPRRRCDTSIPRTWTPPPTDFDQPRPTSTASRRPWWT